MSSKKTSKPPRKISANLAQVADAAGVSKMTVSRILRDSGGFSEETREKVMREIDRLGYVPNRLAATFGSEASSTLVGVCVPRVTSRLYGEVLESIDRTLFRFGYQTLIGTNEELPDVEEKWLRGLLSWRPAGVILSGRNHSSGTLELLKASSTPVVEIWDLNTSPLDVSVGFNHFDCGYEMGHFLIGRGRRHVGYVGTQPTTTTMGSTRFAGFQKALSAAGHPLVAKELLHDRSSFYAGYYGTENLLSRENNLDGIYYQDDEMAIGGLFFCNSRGIDVPGQLAIAGWGGMEAASILPQRLTTTMVSTHGVGKQAAEVLVARLRDEPCKEVVVVPTRLVPGATA
ncbi:MAG: LacI family DNA-binding transcriptional regulator [Hyphomicrobiales bacterium]